MPVQNISLEGVAKERGENDGTNMTGHRRLERWAQVVTAAGLAAAVVAALAISAPAKTHIRVTLTATEHAPGASGVAKLTLRTASKGRLTIKARHLAGGKSFDVVVNGVRIGRLVAGREGNGTARFSTSPTGRAAVLGVDPQGAHIAVRDVETGDDDLEGNMPDEHPGSAIGCCLGNHDDDDPNVECEDLTVADCHAKGGAPTSATSCVPNPCGNQPPPTTVVCCLAHSASGAFVDDDPNVECEDDLSQTECAIKGGMTVQATSCNPNPCQPAPPPNLVICCVSQSHHDDQGDQDDQGGQGDQGEQEGRAQTAARECGQITKCAHITAHECAAVGGRISSATSCEPNPCVASPSGAFLD